MKKAIRDQWLTALRSKNFKQTQGALREEGKGYCCLGVLCELYRRDTGKGRWVKNENGEFSFLDKVGDLPEQVKKWAGIKSINGSIRAKSEFDEQIDSLAAFNDGECSTDPVTNKEKSRYGFKAIASIIEKYWRNL